MNEPDHRSLQERMAVLEEAVAQLQHQVTALNRRLDGSSSGPRSTSPTPPSPTSPRPVAPPGKVGRPQRSGPFRGLSAWQSEDWLNKIGVALLLFGLAFLFKYSIDQGWLTPAVRVGFGASLGAILLGVGLRLRPERARLSQVLLGGSAATFYVTLFAAFQLYTLLSYPVAFGGMVAVTVLTFVLAVRRHDVVLAVVATLGGLGTPFLLFTDDGSLPGLVVYTCLILAGSTLLYVHRGWRSLLATSAAGGWLVFVIAGVEAAFDANASWYDRAAYQAGVLCCWMALGVVPTLRAVWQRRRPERWSVPPLRIFRGVAWIEQPALTLTVLAPLMTMALSRELWTLSDTAWGLLTVGAALAYGAVYSFLRRLDEPRLASAHGVTASLLVLAALFDLIDQADLRLFVVASEAALLHLLARHFEDGVLRRVGHGLFLVLGIVVTVHVFDYEAMRPFVYNPRALADLGALVLCAATAATLPSGKLRGVYRIAAYVLLLAWFWREFSGFEDGQAYVTMAWGGCAAVLMMAGWRRNDERVRKLGLATLLLVVGKLFVLDLARLDAVWRILLFLGIGTMLLLLSYFFPSLWRPYSKKDVDDEEGEPVSS